MERLAIYHAGREVDAGDLMLPAPTPGSQRSLVPDARGSDPRHPTSDSWGGAPRSGHSDDAIPATSIALNVPEGGTTFDDLEREILVQVLARADGNQSRAARSLGLSESTLRSRLKRLGLKG
jgi:transcriptional regulator with GAF, ATPase, and Fis domain